MYIEITCLNIFLIILYFSNETIIVNLAIFTHVRHMFQEAMVKLMRPTPTLPMEHPLLSYECHESDRWTSHEMDAFYQGLLKYNKDFSAISRDVGAKTAKQCVQFYYLWKRLCPDEYKRLRICHGKAKIKNEIKDSKDTKELRDAIASVTEMDFSEDKSILHRTLVSLNVINPFLLQ